MKLDRTIAPIAKFVDQIHILEPQKIILDNGINVYTLNAGSQEVIKIDIQLEAGVWNQTQNLVAIHTNLFLKLGSQKYSASEIAEIFDRRGAYLELSVDQHQSVVTVLCLTRYFDELMTVVEDLIKHPVFPEKEVRSMLLKKRQSFILENEKVKVKAQKRFTQVLFGNNFPYANTNTLEDFDHLSTVTFSEFHSQYYHSNRCKIIIAGRFTDDDIQILNKRFGQNDWAGELNEQSTIPAINSNVDRKHFIPKKDALQSAIRMGRLMPNRTSEDYYGLTLLMMVLGGYFGSRLMSNIREDKGYTYGIGCSYITLPNAAYMNISSEVGVNVIQPALAEIKKELITLQNEPIVNNELQMVKNYMTGELLRSFDGIFAMSHSLKTLLEFNLDYDHYHNYFNALKVLDSEKLQELARKYLEPDAMFEVVAGKY